MFSAFRVSLRRVLSVLLLTTILFFGIGTSVNSQPNSQPFPALRLTAFRSQNAIAASSTRDVTVANMEDSVSNSEYESAKARRQRKQAQRSIAAKTKKNRNSKTIDQKLNLDEEVPESTQRVIDQITDE